MNIVTVKNIHKQYGSSSVLHNVSFALTSDNCVALIGPNGEAKPTKLRILTGIIKPNSVDYNMHNETKDIRSLIGYLLLHPVFHQWMTVEEILIYSAKLTGISHHKAKERT